jgi:hypothetical protein
MRIAPSSVMVDDRAKALAATIAIFEDTCGNLIQIHQT